MWFFRNTKIAIVAAIIFIICFMLICDKAMGQEMIEIGSWSNVETKDLGNGKKSWKMTLNAVSYRVYQNGDTIIHKHGNGKDEFIYTVDKATYSGSVKNGRWSDNSDIVNNFHKVKDKSKKIKKINKKIIERLFSPGVFDTIPEHHEITKNGKVKLRIYEGSSIFSWQPDSQLVGDSYVYEGDAAVNYGNNPSLWIGTLDAGGDQNFRAYVRLDSLLDSLGGVFVTTTIDSASLILKEKGNYTSGFNAWVQTLGEAFVEADITWANFEAPTIANPYSEDTIGVATGGLWIWEIEAMMTKLIQGDNIYYGFRIMTNEPSGTHRVELYSSDNATANNPKIYVEYTLIIPDAILTLNTLSETSIEAVLDTVGLSTSDSFRIFNNQDSTALNAAFTVLKDTTDTLTVGLPYILFARGYYDSPVDSFYTNLDTATTHYLFTMATSIIDTSSLSFILDTTGITTFDSFRIVDVGTENPIGGFLPKGVTADTLDTLDINTLYGVRAEVFVNNIRWALSDSDSVFTDIIPFLIDTAYFQADSIIFVKMDNRGNPSYSLVSVIDCMRVEKGSTNVWLDPDSSKYLSTRPYRNYDDWGGVNGTTINLISTEFTANDTVKIRIISTSGDSTAKGL